MHRHYRFALGLLLGPLSLMAAAEPPDFLAVQRMGFQAQVSDAPQGSGGFDDGSGYSDGSTPTGAVSGPMGGPMSNNAGPLDYQGDLGGMCDDCNCNGRCSGPPRGFWGRAEAVYWWLNGSSAPPLLTTSPAGTPQAQAGILPNATVLFPTSNLNTEGRFGGRFTVGYWLDSCETIGFQGNFFLLDNRSENMSATSDITGSPILARPFFNTATGLEDAALVAFPGLVAGQALVHTNVRLMGAEGNFRHAIWNDRVNRLDVLAGYRFLRFDDSILMQANSLVVSNAGPVPNGTIFSTSDNFGTRNQFHGGQVGLNWQRNHGRWGWDAVTKFAFGGMRQQAIVQGNTTVVVPNSPVINETGGFFALASNSGVHDRTVFSLIPELNSNLYYQLTPLWRVNVGYTLFYVTQVLRASNQIDRRIDPAQFPPGIRGTFPAFAFHSSTLWVQGVSVGLECRF